MTTYEFLREHKGPQSSKVLGQTQTERRFAQIKEAFVSFVNAIPKIRYTTR